MNERECALLVRRRACSMLDEVDEYMEHLPCEHCSTWSSRLERHHRQFRSRGGLWVPSNIILLCHLCHQRTTDELTGGSGLNVPTGVDPSTVPVRVWYCPQPVLFHDDGVWLPAA